MTFITIDILDDLVWMHNRFRLENNRGRGNSAEGIVCSEDLVCFGQAFTSCTNFFPDEGHGIHTEELNAEICEEEHLTSHGSKDGRVGIIEVPLVMIEGGPDPAAVWKADEGPGVIVPKACQDTMAPCGVTYGKISLVVFSNACGISLSGKIQ